MAPNIQPSTFILGKWIVLWHLSLVKTKNNFFIIKAKQKMA